MTKYTAEDFARARVAIQGERESARRTYPGDDMPWLSRNGGRWSDHLLAELGWTPVQESQPLTADDITDEMVERARKVWETAHGCEDIGVTLRRALTAALTEPPARPEGAEEIEADIAAWYGENGMPTGGTGDRLADHLAAMGYRKDKQ